MPTSGGSRIASANCRNRTRPPPAPGNRPAAPRAAARRIANGGTLRGLVCAGIRRRLRNRAGATRRSRRPRRPDTARPLRGCAPGALAAEPASRLVFVDFDGVSDPEPAAERLAEVCAFETAVVAVGVGRHGAQFSRALLRRGIAGLPRQTGFPRPWCARPARPRRRRRQSARMPGAWSRLPAVPGSGTSTLVAAVARGVAADGRSASVVDLDPVGGKLAALLDRRGRRRPFRGCSPRPARDASSDPEPAEPAVPAVDPGGIDGISVSAAPGISLIGYPAARSAAGAGPPVPMLWALLEHLANRDPCRPGDRPDRAGDADRGDAAGGRPGAGLRAQPAERQRRRASAGVARCGRSLDAGPVLDEDAPLSDVAGAYPLCARRPAPRSRHPLRARAARGARPANAPGRPGKPYRKALRRATELLGHGWSPPT